jgi:hypothetical protein
VLVASFLYFPYSQTGPVLCPTALVLGLPCPGCGMTRALGCATHGHFRAAFEFHAIWPLVLGYMGFLWLYQLIEVVRGEPPALPVYKIAGTALVGLLCFWALRLAFFFQGGGLAVMAHDNLIARLGRLLW